MPVPPPAPDASEASLPLIVLQHQAYLYAPQHIALARSAHHLTPMLTGTLPLLSQQNVFLGPPAVLLPEEAVLLLRRGAAHLVDDAAAHRAPTAAEAAAFHAAREENIALQRRTIAAAAARAREVREREAYASDKAKAKREARAKSKAVAGVQGEEEEESLFGPSKGEGSVAGSSKDGASEGYVHLTPATTSPDAPWYEAAKHTYVSLRKAQQAGIWTFPATLEERARFLVFENLHSKGYFLNNGLRFGGDYNCYPGDPLRYHSHFTATVLATPTTPVSAQELIASGRLGTAVKKAHLICGVDGAEAELQDRGPQAQGEEQEGGVKFYYFSLTWAGFGT